METNDCIKGVVIGGLIGLVAGILYAPKSGKETRERILQTKDDLWEKGIEQYEQTVQKIENLVSHEKESIIEKKERLKKAFEAGMETLKEGKGDASAQL